MRIFSEYTIDHMFVGGLSTSDMTWMKGKKKKSSSDQGLNR